MKNPGTKTKSDSEIEQGMHSGRNDRNESSTQEDVQKYLLFRLMKETYAVDVRFVEEVLDCVPIVVVPRCPDFLRGIINLRGRIIPVLDMRMRFEMPPCELTEDSRLVVLQMRLGREDVSIAATMDAVEGVADITPDMIDPAPRIGSAVSRETVSGVVRYNDGRVFIILDVNRILTDHLLEHSFKEYRSR
jgi:purine-binding chemotaxis protein CheW